MTVYFFDMTIDGKTGRDDVGQDLQSIEAAQTEAVLSLPDFARALVEDERDNVMSMSVRTADDRVVLRATMTLSVEIIPTSHDTAPATRLSGLVNEVAPVG